MLMTTTKPTPSCGCPVAAFQKIISGKYKLRIVWDLEDGRTGSQMSGIRALYGQPASGERGHADLPRSLRSAAAQACAVNYAS